MSRNEISLKVIINDEVLFQSNRKWIHPIFDFEDFLKINPLKLNNVKIYDKVVGKAAALLLFRLGVVWIHGEVMSELAVNALTQWRVKFAYDELVKRIDCKTEKILFEVNEPEIAYSILCKRANRC